MRTQHPASNLWTSTLMPVGDHRDREVTEHFEHKIKFKRIKVD